MTNVPLMEAWNLFSYAEFYAKKECSMRIITRVERKVYKLESQKMFK